MLPERGRHLCQIKEASSVKGDGTFSTAINGLQDGQQYSARAYAINEVGVGYGERGTFDTPTADRPEVRTGTDYVAGVDRVYVSVSLDGDGGFPITEKGICWSVENTAPTIDDQLVEAGEGQDDFYSLIKGLQTNETYYVRGYAKNDKGIGYGTTLEVRTLEMGNVTFTLHGDIDPEIYDRIKGAFDEAVDYYNRYTNIEKHLNVYYNPGVPTADGNFNGTIRIGPNPSYQRTGTAMHEIAHVVGVGQHWKWNELIQDGKYTGQRGNRILQLLTGDPDAQINGDGLHFWPYGINGAHEDNGDPDLYIRHALLVQGMKADGLPDN